MHQAKEKLWAAALTLMSLLVIGAEGTPAQAQTTRVIPLERKFDLGRGMSSINADLMQIAAKTDFFLRFAREINLTGEQRKKLEEMYFEIQKYSLRREVDLDVADAELRRLLSNDRVDLAAVRSKVKEIETIQTEATTKKIEAVLQAIAVLTHDQHLKVMLLVREMIERETPQQMSAPQT
jgi:Spy/CpxP family protein refolding chaperone